MFRLTEGGDFPEALRDTNTHDVLLAVVIKPVRSFAHMLDLQILQTTLSADQARVQRICNVCKFWMLCM